MEDDMEDMVADATLWAIFAVAIVFISLGCRVTRRVPKAVTQNPDQQINRQIDRAA
jgi:hypothetical protein